MKPTIISFDRKNRSCDIAQMGMSQLEQLLEATVGKRLREDLYFEDTLLLKKNKIFGERYYRRVMRYYENRTHYQPAYRPQQSYRMAA